MRAGVSSKPLIFVVTGLLVAALVYGSISAFNALALPSEAPSNADCYTRAVSNVVTGYHGYVTECCWFETDPGDPEGIELEYCQGCDYDPSTQTQTDCGPKIQQGPSPPPSGPLAPLQDGVLEQPATPPLTGPFVVPKQGILEQTPSEGVIPPLEQGQDVLPQEGVFEQQPADQGAAEPPANEGTEPTPETLPICRGGQVLDEETGLCVLEEPTQPEADEPEVDEELPVEEDSSNN